MACLPPITLGRSGVFHGVVASVPHSLPQTILQRRCPGAAPLTITVSEPKLKRFKTSTQDRDERRERRRLCTRATAPQAPPPKVPLAVEVGVTAGPPRVVIRPAGGMAASASAPTLYVYNPVGNAEEKGSRPQQAAAKVPSATGPQVVRLPTAKPPMEVKLAVLMGRHPRLGRHASLRRLPCSVLATVFAFVGGEVTIPLDVVCSRLAAKGRRLLRKSRDENPFRVTRIHHRATDVHIAIKPIPSNLIPADPSYFMQRLQAAWSVVGPCVLPCYGVVVLEHRVCMALAHMDASLKDVFGRGRGGLPEPAAAAIMFQIVHGLASVHEQTKAPHGILRPGRVLLARDGRVAVGGLPCAAMARRKMESRIEKDPRDELRYIPITSGGSSVALEDDVWTVGLLAYRTLSGMEPFASLGSHPSLFSAFKVIHSEAPPRLECGTPLAKAFVSECLMRNRASRASLHRLAMHPWMASCGIATVDDARRVLAPHLEAILPPPAAKKPTSRRRRVALRTGR